MRRRATGTIQWGTVEMTEAHGDLDLAEGELRRLGLTQVGVRRFGDAAWLELPADQLALIAHDPLRGEVVRALQAAGFNRVAAAIDGL